MRRLETPKRCKHFRLNSKCKHCIALYDEWNQRLKATEDESFKDVELSSGKHKRILKKDANTVSILDKDQQSRAQEANFEYYERLHEAATQEFFDSEVNKLIMFERAHAKKIAEIVRILKKNHISMHRETVRFTIRRFEHKWKIRVWTMEQMGLKPQAPTKSFKRRRPTWINDTQIAFTLSF